MASKLERDYQAYLIKRLKRMFPGCQVLKNDTSYQQGIPDLSFFNGPFWAWLEVKPRANARQEPNQDWFIEYADMWSFGAFIYPENEEEVLRDLQQALRARLRRDSRLSKSQ